MSPTPKAKLYCYVDETGQDPASSVFVVAVVVSAENQEAFVFVDGIDRQKASGLTNALRVRGVSLEKVRSRRDESEPMIRLADMWAGCTRAAREGSQEEAKMLDAALNLRCVWSLVGLPQKRKTP